MPKERKIIYNNLASLLAAGLPILRCLTAAAANIKTPLARTITNLTGEISTGNTLAEAMAKYPGHFPPLDISVIETAETSGSLAESFKLLAHWYTFTGKIKRKMTAAMVFPLAILHFAAFIIPLPILFLGGITPAQYPLEVIKVCAQFYVPMLTILAVFLLGPKIPTLKRLVDSLILKIPVLGEAILYLSLARYSRSFYILCKAGLPITLTTQKSADLVSNSIIAGRLRPAAASTQKGNPAWQGLSKKLPQEFTSLWEIGEESGQLEDSTRRLAEMTEDKAFFLFEQLAVWIPKLAYLYVCVLMVIGILKGLAAIQANYPAF